nr:hypothetical protein [Brucella rhizosphaerae]
MPEKSAFALMPPYLSIAFERIKRMPQCFTTAPDDGRKFAFRLQAILLFELRAMQIIKQA